MSENKEENIIDKMKSSIGISVGLIVIAVFAYKFPSTFGSKNITQIIAIFLMMTGLTLLNGEIYKINHGSRSYNTENIGVGLFFTGIWALLYYFMPVWYVNIISFTILLFGIFGITRGLLEALKFVLAKGTSAGGQIAKVSILIIMVASLAFSGWKIFDIVTNKNVEVVAPSETGSI